MNKTTCDSIRILKASDGSYDVIIKSGRKTTTFSLANRNAARSFARRNYTPSMGIGATR
tara:strand:- start:333 stop:509 length:177 start_codon:yes stop_codon:yes gene_type:complete